MREWPDLDPDKRYYSIGEVAEYFDVNASLIRFWEKEFPSLHPKKNLKGKRKFSPDDIKELRSIYHLVKERGFTLDGAKNKLRTDKSAVDQKAELAEHLLRLKASLENLKQQL
jgi:DNA-binding transcriptional MerR regulator